MKTVFNPVSRKSDPVLEKPDRPDHKFFVNPSYEKRPPAYENAGLFFVLRKLLHT
jgi:hypothetical protein